MGGDLSECAGGKNDALLKLEQMEITQHEMNKRLSVQKDQISHLKQDRDRAFEMHQNAVDRMTSENHRLKNMLESQTEGEVIKDITLLTDELHINKPSTSPSPTYSDTSDMIIVP